MVELFFFGLSGLNFLLKDETLELDWCCALCSRTYGSSNPAFPHFEWARLIVSHIFRFLLNLIFSLGIVHFLFLNKKWTFQAMVLITLSFIIFFPIYLYSVYTEFSFGNLFSFYIRRFVIQPLPVLLIVPLFYHRKNLIK